MSLVYALTASAANSYLSGWLSPDGHFYGCKPTEHDSMSELFFNRTVEDLESSGWCRVLREPSTVIAGTWTWLCMRSLTAYQRNWLQLHGHNLDWDY